jgi:hypothetical protein
MYSVTLIAGTKVEGIQNRAGIATRRFQGQHGNTLEKQHVFGHLKDQHSLPVPNSLLLRQLLNHSIRAVFPCIHGQISGSSVLHSADKTR